MAEFIKVVEELKRREGATDNLIQVSISVYDGGVIRNTSIINTPEDMEKNVMAWAAAHPEKSEPVYPKWREWWNGMMPNGSITTARIVEISIDGIHIELSGREVRIIRNGESVVVMYTNDRIPADIAEKLNIKPLNAGPVDDNPPLTVDELMGMDGEPVWLENFRLLGSTLAGWHLVDAGSRYLRSSDGAVYQFISIEHWNIRLYRRKPDGEGANNA